ncbi:MAG TPA: hypothetical protein VGM97_04675 [Steroidobacteraceae bacterium]|jgi:hypothetical protein
MKMLRSFTLATLVLTAPLVGAADEFQFERNAPADSDYYSPLASAVRAATQQYQRISVATAAGYVVPATACVSGPDHGAMGIHYANPAVIGSGTLDLRQPAILIYEPQSDGTMQLVGVEYVLPLGLWTNGDSSKDPNTPPPPGAAMPNMDGQQMNYQPQPNRYGQGNSFYLHLWAWRYNPKGLFSDWNPNVTCTKPRH